MLKFLIRETTMQPLQNILRDLRIKGAVLNVKEQKQILIILKWIK